MHTHTHTHARAHTHTHKFMHALTHVQAQTNKRTYSNTLTLILFDDNTERVTMKLYSFPYIVDARCPLRYANNDRTTAHYESTNTQYFHLMCVRSEIGNRQDKQASGYVIKNCNKADFCA